MRYFLKFIFISLSLSFLLTAQNFQNGKARSPKDGSLRSYASKKLWDKSSPIQSHNEYTFSKTCSGIVDTAWVRHYASDVAPPWGCSSAIAVDTTGNVYVTGYSYASFSNNDYVTIKYNSNGDTLWVARYNGPGNSSDDQAAAITLDKSGNVYVTGRSDSNYVTVKYNSSGVQQWAVRSNDSKKFGSWFYWAASITVDASGNVYMTGWWGNYVENTHQTDTWTCIIKYNSAGVQQWVAHNNGSVVFDEAAAIAVDASGNVYVTSTSGTIKYNSNGVQQWIANKSAKDLALDASGNVYVTGSNGTIKYNNNGVQQWIKNQNANDLVLDTTGNVYVTGEYGTIKYNSNGVQQWIASSGAGTLALDASGNVYVTGWGRTTKYNSKGDTIWVARYDPFDKDWLGGEALAVDASENVYVTGWGSMGMSAPDYWWYRTLKYNSEGIKQWANDYTNPGNFADVASDLAVDGVGNIYVTGTRTIKYNSNGVLQWVAPYGGVVIALDASGNVYVTGTSPISGTYGDYITVKYNSNGDTLWVARYNGLGNFSDDIAAALTVDASGNVYVTGRTGSDYATIKYNSAGVEQWVARTAGESERAIAIAIDTSGNVYMTGLRVTIKYNTAGVQQWVVGNIGLASASAMAVDASGNVYVTGTNGPDYSTIKYNTAGVQQWIARYHAPGNSDGGAAALAVDTSGNVYVTGQSGGDFGTVKYNSNGDTVWVARYNGPGNQSDWAAALALDASGNVYVTGRSDNDFATVKYNSAGVQQWVARYNGPGNQVDQIAAITLDKSGNVYVTGTSCANWTNYPGPNEGIFTTIKYTQSPTFVNEQIQSDPEVFALGQNYPNPFNPSTTLRFSIPERSNVRLSIFNTLGQKISEIVNETKDAGTYEQSFNASQLSSGIYFYRIEATSVSNSKTFVETKKMVLMK